MSKNCQLDLFPTSKEGRVVDAIPQHREKLRVDEVAKILNCTDQHVYNLIFDGSLEAINIARDLNTRPVYRIYTSSLTRFQTIRKEGAQ